MLNSRFSLWAASAATAMTLATGLLIGALADVDASATGLPILYLERFEVGPGARLTRLDAGTGAVGSHSMSHGSL